MFVVVDDMTYDDVYAVMSGGRRDGERCLESLHTRIGDQGTWFAYHRGTASPCGTTRAEIHTGNAFRNHGIETNMTDPVVGTKYVAAYRDGFKTTTANYSHNLGWCGPWEFDLAAQAGLPTTSVNASDQTGRRDSDDDLQAFSGCIWNWLPRDGVNVALLGKYQNGYHDADTIIPPGITFAKIHSGDENSSLQKRTYKEFSGLNPYDGAGATAPADTTYNCIVTISSSAINGTQRRVVCNSAHGFDTEDIGGEVWFSGATVARTLTQIESSKIFWIDGTTAPGGSLFQRRWWQPIQLANWFVEWVDTQSDDDRFFAYIAPEICHVGPNGTYQGMIEAPYQNTVESTANPWYYDGIAGGESPVGPHKPASGYASQWASRQMALASASDMLDIIIDKLESRFGVDGFTIIFTSDNGDQVGQQSGRGDGGSKIALWDGSLRVGLWARGPDFLVNDVNVNNQTFHIDIPATLLDVFGLTAHYAHTKRDGVSIIRQISGSPPFPNRAVPVYGMAAAQLSDGYVDETNRKYVRFNQSQISSNVKYFRYKHQTDTGDPADDYELVSHALDTPNLATVNARADALQSGRYDPATDTNTIRTA